MTEGTNTPTHECFPAQTRGENVLNVPLVQLLQPPQCCPGYLHKRAEGRGTEVVLLPGRHLPQGQHAWGVKPLQGRQVCASQGVI